MLCAGLFVNMLCAGWFVNMLCAGWFVNIPCAKLFVNMLCASLFVNMLITGLFTNIQTIRLILDIYYTLLYHQIKAHWATKRKEPISLPIKGHLSTDKGPLLHQTDPPYITKSHQSISKAHPSIASFRALIQATILFSLALSLRK